MEQLRAFLGSIKWAAEENDECTTWPELYVLFRINAGDAFCRNGNITDKAVTIGSEIKASRSV